MDALAHHLRLHLAATAATLDLFGRSAPAQHDPETGAAVQRIREEVLDERRRLRAMAERCGVRESTLLTTGARAGERLGRFKPNESLVRRTRLTDLVELEAMLATVAVKEVAWHALLAVADDVDGLDPAELAMLLERATEQRAVLMEHHGASAPAALSRG